MYYAKLFSQLFLTVVFVWPFKFIRWCIRKIRDRRYDVDFSEYSDEDTRENEEAYLISTNNRSASDINNLSPHPNSSLKHLWYNGSSVEWHVALLSYYDILTPEQRILEDYIENIDVNEIKNLSEIDFYHFLHDKYFVWKYTAKNRLATTRKHLEKYIQNEELSVLKNIQDSIFRASKNNVAHCLEIACKIYGLGTAGASGLLAILFPEHFGTVDQFVVKRLREIDHPLYGSILHNMNPENLKTNDGIILIEIMKEKAAELNNRFNTDFWTPRKIDMILWVFGR